MGKVNCGFCGTAFSDTEEKCPMCGFARNISKNTTEDDILLDEEFAFLNEEVMPKRKNKQIFNYDEVNAEEDEEQDEESDEYDSYDEDEEDEDQPRSNTFLVVILVIIITLLLLATGFLVE